MTKQKFEVEKYKKIVIVSTILRLISGPFIFISAWIAFIITFILDWIDGELFKRAGYPHHQYSLYDKILDYYWYTFILIYVFVQSVPGKELLLFLFLFRSFGQIIYFFMKKRVIFFFFPNLFEFYFLFYLLTTSFPKLQPLMYFPKIIYPSIIIVLFVMIREYILHVKKMNLSGLFTGKTTFWIKEKKQK